MDRRIQRTHALLHAALAALLREKVYDRITVADILDRANIGRSTFYIHFRDKDELLTSSIRGMLLPIRAAAQSVPPDPCEALVGFSLPFLQHIHAHRRSAKVNPGERGRAILHDRLRYVLAEWIAESIGSDVRHHGCPPGRIENRLLAQYIASTFVLVLHWWLDCEGPSRAEEANERFRALVMPTLRAERAEAPDKRIRRIAHGQRN